MVLHVKVEAAPDAIDVGKPLNVAVGGGVTGGPDEVTKLTAVPAATGVPAAGS